MEILADTLRVRLVGSAGLRRQAEIANFGELC